MSIISLEKGRALGAEIARVAWRSLQVAAAIVVVVVPFGYTITGAHADVFMGAAAGLTIGIGLNLRMGARNGRSVGILVGSTVGATTALIAGLLPGDPWGPLAAPVLAIALGLIDGLGETRIRGYREAILESALVSALLGVAFLVAALLFAPDAIGGVLACAVLIVSNGFVVGFLNRNHEGRRYSRPPLLLVVGFLVVLAFSTYLGMTEEGTLRPVNLIILIPGLGLVAVPALTFLAARTVARWIQPRLRLYLQLTDYLRVMWVPIGGFALGYLVIIVLFASFSGMLERFVPGSFSGGAGANVLDWIAFSFYSAIAEPYSTIRPASGIARFLLGTQLVLSIGWALVVFAAVMSAIQPQLDAISRRRAQDGD